MKYIVNFNDLLTTIKANVVEIDHYPVKHGLELSFHQGDNKVVVVIQLNDCSSDDMEKLSEMFKELKSFFP